MFEMLKKMFKKADSPINVPQPVDVAPVDSPDMVKPVIKKQEGLTEGKTRGAKKKSSSTSPSPKTKSPKAKVKDTPLLTPKEIATANGEPYIDVVKVNIDENDINNGSFELDWNDKFIINLIKTGYKMKQTDTDQDIIDRWFTQVCRNVALEMYEQDQADPDHRQTRVIKTKDIGNGRSEIS